MEKGMTMEQFVMILDEEFPGYKDGSYLIAPWFIDGHGGHKQAFKNHSNYAWALERLEKYVEENVGSGYEPIPIYKFVDAVAAFEYEMQCFSEVDPHTWRLFYNAKTIAESVEDVLNAML